MPIIQEFIGEIDNVIINDENVYFTVEHVTDAIEEKFKIRNPKLTEDLFYAIDMLYYENDTPIGELEEEIHHCLSKANTFKDLKFEIFGSTDKLDKLNENIKNRVYENSKESTIE